MSRGQVDFDQGVAVQDRPGRLLVQQQGLPPQFAIGIGQFIGHGPAGQLQLDVPLAIAGHVTIGHDESFNGVELELVSVGAGQDPRAYEERHGTGVRDIALVFQGDGFLAT